MNMDTSNQAYNWTRTGEFNGIPCRVIEECHIILDRQGKSTREFAGSEEFQMLENAGIEVHGGAYS